MSDSQPASSSKPTRKAKEPAEAKVAEGAASTTLEDEIFSHARFPPVEHEAQMRAKKV